MKKIPPHLPPPSCSVTTHKQLDRVKIFVLSIGSGLVAGLVGALLMINAWYPTAYNNTAVVLPNRSANTATLDSTVVRDWRARLITVYDESKLATSEYYLPSARLTTSVVVNSAGWAVAPLTKINKASAIGLDYQGHRLPIETTVVDDSRGLMFIKFKGSDFRATASFATPASLQTGRVIWGYNGEWQPYTIGQKIPAPVVVSVMQAIPQFSLNELGSENRLLITDRGELLGFSTANRTIVPVWMVGELLPKIITGTKPPFVALNWRGSFVEESRQENSSLVKGFLITDPGKTTDVHKGDVLVEVAGQTVTPDTLGELVLFAPDTFAINVLRGGKNLSISIKK